MNFSWIVVGLAGWALALVFVLLLMRMASQQDRAARHSEKTLHPFSDVTITRAPIAMGSDSRKFTITRAGTLPSEHIAGAPDAAVTPGPIQGTGSDSTAPKESR